MKKKRRPFSFIVTTMVLDEYQALDKQNNDLLLQFLTRVEKQPTCKRERERHTVYTADMATLF